MVSAYILGGERVGDGYGKCQFAFQKTFLQLKSNTTGKCQKWSYNEFVLETLIGRIFFSFLLFFFFFILGTLFSWGLCFRSDSH